MMTAVYSPIGWTSVTDTTDKETNERTNGRTDERTVASLRPSVRPSLRWSLTLNVWVGTRSLSLGQTPGTVFFGWSDASSCLPLSSVVYRLSCSHEPTTFLLTFLTTRPWLTYVKRFRIRVHCHPLLFLIYCFSTVLYFYIVKHRRPYFFRDAIQIWSIAWFIKLNNYYYIPVLLLCLQ